MLNLLPGDRVKEDELSSDKQLATSHPQAIPTKQLLRKDESPQDLALRAHADILKYPRHILSTRTTGERQTKIRIGEKTKDQEYWWVTPNLDEEFGVPGRLSFEFDYQIALPAIYEATNKAQQAGQKLGSRYIVVGYLKNIAKQLGRRGSGRDMEQVKNAIKRNAGSMIDCNAVLRKAKKQGGGLEYVNGVFTAYTVYFRGSQLEDGTVVEKVILALSEPFWLAVNALDFTKPLDAQYFKQLGSSAPQRWYTLVSTDIFVTLNKRLPEARRRYSNYCIFHPQKRYKAFSDMKRQMNKLHQKHLDNGYIESVHYEQTRDEQGIVDWLIFYKPGQKARDEYNKLRGKKITPPTPKNQLSQSRNLMNELTKRGVTEAIAIDLVKQYPDRIIPQTNYFDFLKKNYNNKVSQNPAGFLRVSIEQNYATPPNYLSPEEHQSRIKQHQASKARQVLQDKIYEYKQWQEMTPTERVKGDLWVWEFQYKKEHGQQPTTEQQQAKQQELIEQLPTEEEMQIQLFGKIFKQTEELF